jgi:tight adherence protein C
MDDLLYTLTNPQFLFAMLSAIAVAATVFTIAVPLLAKNDLAARKKRMAVERSAIRARERAALARESHARPTANAAATAEAVHAEHRRSVRP